MSTKKNVSKFPSKLYAAASVGYEDFFVHNNIKECIETTDDKKIIAVYELKEVREVKVNLEEIPANTAEYKIEG